MYVGNLLGQSTQYQFKPADKSIRQSNVGSLPEAGITIALKQVKRRPIMVPDHFKPLPYLKGSLPTLPTGIQFGGQLDVSKEDALNKRDAPILKMDLDDDGLRRLQEQMPPWLFDPTSCGDVEIPTRENGISNNFDFIWASIDMDVASQGAEELGQSIDCMASRFAALKERIESEYSGEGKAFNLERLDKMMDYYKNELAQHFANTVGGIFEDNGASDVKSRLYQSVLSEVNQRTQQYSAFIKKQPDYADIAGPDEAWLKKDTSYMASELRKALSGTAMGQTQRICGSGEFSLDEMEKLQDFSQEFKSYFSNNDSSDVNRILIGEESEESLGIKLAQLHLKGKVFNQYAGVSDGVKEIVTQSIDHFIADTIEQQQAYMDKWSQIQIAGYEKLRADREISSGLAQRYIGEIQRGFSPVDKNAVYAVIDKVSEVYETSGNASVAILEGAAFAHNQFAEKQESGLYEGIHRYDRGDLYWLNFFTKQDGIENPYQKYSGYNDIVDSWNDFMKKVSSEDSAFLTKFRVSFIV